jgi:hypothetical protein
MYNRKLYILPRSLLDLVHRIQLHLSSRHIVVYPILDIIISRHSSLFIQGITGGTDQTSGECSLGQTIPI